MSTQTKPPKETCVLVTGITGFLAGHIAFQLLQQGYRVRGSVRSSQRRAKIESRLRSAIAENGGELTFVETDLNRDENWNAAVTDCDYVIHTASPFSAINTQGRRGIDPHRT
jgi:nucleoside-diphosphate-sugar epimerase